MSVRSDPAPYWSPSPAALRVPFSIAREDRLLVVTLWVLEGNLPLGILSLVPASTLLGALASLPPGAHPPREFAWAEWGPRGSRLMSMPGAHSPVWVCYVYGTTYALWAHDGEQSKAVYTLDFNQLAIRHRAGTAAGAGDGEPEQIRERIVAEASVFEPSRVFKGEVVTTLPYMERIFMPFQSMPMTEDGEFDQVMLTEDALLLVAGVSSDCLHHCTRC